MTRRAAALALLLVSSASAQEPAVVGVAAEGGAVRVGEPFRVGVLLRAPGAASLDLALREPVGRPFERVDSARAYPAPAPATHRVVATLVVWVVDPPASIPAEARVTLADGTVRTIPVELPAPAVRAVLPADSTAPRPPKDVVPLPPAERFPWRWLALAGAALVLLLLAIGWILRRRTRRAGPPDPDRRARALAELDALRREGLIESGALETFYARLSRILRDLEAPEVGADLTTSEAVDRLRRGGAPEAQVERLAALLSNADRAKFARVPPSGERAAEDWQTARAWVERGAEESA